MDFDVVIVGAGVHALALARRLREPDGLDVGFWASGQRAAPWRVCVCDPEAWCGQWHRQLAALGIEALRSPLTMHPETEDINVCKKACEKGQLKGKGIGCFVMKNGKTVFKQCTYAPHCPPCHSHGPGC